LLAYSFALIGRPAIGKPDEEVAASCAHAQAPDKVIEGNAMN
jgi:hypothetical protein